MVIDMDMQERILKEMSDARESGLYSVASLDMFNIVQYRFGLNGSVDYSHYLNSLSPSDHALVDMMDKFVGDTFVEYENKLSLIIE